MIAQHLSCGVPDATPGVSMVVSRGRVSRVRGAHRKTGPGPSSRKNFARSSRPAAAEVVAKASRRRRDRVAPASWGVGHSAGRGGGPPCPRSALRRCAPARRRRSACRRRSRPDAGVVHRRGPVRAAQGKLGGEVASRNRSPRLSLPMVASATASRVESAVRSCSVRLPGCARCQCGDGGSSMRARGSIDRGAGGLQALDLGIGGVERELQRVDRSLAARARWRGWRRCGLRPRARRSPLRAISEREPEALHLREQVVSRRVPVAARAFELGDARPQAPPPSRAWWRLRRGGVDRFEGRIEPFLECWRRRGRQPARRRKARPRASTSALTPVSAVRVAGGARTSARPDPLRPRSRPHVRVGVHAVDRRAREDAQGEAVEVGEPPEGAQAELGRCLDWRARSERRCRSSARAPSRPRSRRRVRGRSVRAGQSRRARRRNSLRRTGRWRPRNPAGRTAGGRRPGRSLPAAAPRGARGNTGRPRKAPRRAGAAAPRSNLHQLLIMRGEVLLDRVGGVRRTLRPAQQAAVEPQDPSALDRDEAERDGVVRGQREALATEANARARGWRTAISSWRGSGSDSGIRRSSTPSAHAATWGTRAVERSLGRPRRRHRRPGCGSARGRGGRVRGRGSGRR